MENIPGYSEALRTRDAHLSSRAKDLWKLEAFVAGEQYEGLDNFFSDKKPLWERAPCIVSPIVKMAISSNRDLLLGEGRWPHFKIQGQTGEEADQFEKGVADIISQARLAAVADEMFDAAQAAKSSCAIFSIINNRIDIKTVYARWCTPTFDAEGAVRSLEIKYPYLDIVTDGKQSKVVCKLYRRVIDDVLDVTYHPATVTEDDVHHAISWSVDFEVAHGFGFCPVIYYAHMRSCAVTNEFDGHAIHEQLLDEIRAYDFAESQWYRAIMYSGDPQWTEIGVRSGSDPSGGSGKKAVLPNLFNDSIPAEGGMGVYVGSIGYGSGPARKKGPGIVWQYDVPDASKVKIELHTLPGDALTAIQTFSEKLKAKLAEALGVVLLDPGSLPNESRLSGKALETFVRPQLSRVDTYRKDFGDHFLIPAIGMLIRISLVKNLPFEKLGDLRGAIAKVKNWSWHCPAVQAVWGEYFEPSAEEYELLVRGTVEALGGKPILTVKAAVERLRNVLGIKDVDAYLKELKAETDEQEAKDLKRVGEEAKATAAAKPAPAPRPKA